MRLPTRIRGADGSVNFQLQVFRVDEPEAIVRTLSSDYGGILVHHIPPKGGEYCRGDECPSKWHTKEKVWKGYFSGEWWEPAGKLWIPAVVEITENCEVDMRDLYARGQIWRLKRGILEGAKYESVSAELLEEGYNSKFPQPYPILPVLQRLYRWTKITLNVKNPLPPRIMVTPTQGDAPLCESQAPGSPEERDGKRIGDIWRERIAAELDGIGAMPQRNGRK